MTLPAAGGTRTVPALGGIRSVQAPDPIARDYLLLALRLDQRLPGLVDGYFGPGDLKAQVDMEQLRAPARLRDDARTLRDRVATDIPDDDRRGWLTAQLVALEAQAAILAGESMPYVEQVERYLGWTPIRRDEAELEDAAARIDALLPVPALSPTASPRGTSASRSRSIGCQPSSTGSSRTSEVGRRGCSASRTARICG